MIWWWSEFDSWLSEIRRFDNVCWIEDKVVEIFQLDLISRQSTKSDSRRRKLTSSREVPSFSECFVYKCFSTNLRALKSFEQGPHRNLAPPSSNLTCFAVTICNSLRAHQYSILDSRRQNSRIERRSTVFSRIYRIRRYHQLHFLVHILDP